LRLHERWVRSSLGLLILLAFVTAGVPAQERRVNFRAVHYEIDATLDASAQLLSATAKVEFQAISTAPSRVVEVELHPNLRVDAVRGVDGKPVEFERDTEKPLLLRVTLPLPPAPEHNVTLTFEYSGPLASAENSPAPGLQLANIDEKQSYLLLPARWFPLTNFPANRYTAVYRITVPETMAVVGTGTAGAPTAAPAPPRPPAKPGATEPPPAPSPRITYTFRAEQAQASGTFVAGELKLVPVKIGATDVPVYVFPADSETATAYGQAVASAVEYFSATFGPLPDPRLTLAELPDGTMQGYSAPGMLLVSKRQWDPRGNERLLSQLVAAQWWANTILPASPNDVWVADGLARYSEGLYAEHRGEKAGFDRALQDFAIGALMYENAAPVAQAGRLDLYGSEYRSVVMNKGAMIFHMLRAQVGDDAFRAILQDYFLRYAGKSASIADFEQVAQQQMLRRVTAESPAQNLRPFFAQWLNSTGIPEFRLEYIVMRTPKGFRITGKIKHDLETFSMPVEIRVATDGNPETKTIQVVGSDSDFTIETFGRPKPEGITLDPNNHLLKSSPKLRVRAPIARGEELAEEGQFYDAIQQYQVALDMQRNNSLASFRMGEALFFQKNYQAAANAFRDAQEGDLDPDYKWVEVWSHIYLGKIFDVTGQRERALNEYRRAQETNDDTGGAQAEAERYIKEPYQEEVRRAGTPSS